MLEHANGIGQLHQAVAVVVSSQRLVGGQGFVGAVNLQTDNHLEDGYGVLQVDGG